MSRRITRSGGRPSETTVSPTSSYNTRSRRKQVPELPKPDYSSSSDESPPHTPRSRHIAENRRAAFALEAQRLNEGNLFRSDLYEFEKPRQLFFLAIAVALLAYFGLTRESSHDSATNFKYMIGGVAVVFLMYCSLQVRDGLLVRPHPAVWRMLHGVAVLYLLLLSALFVLPLKEARHVIQLLAPSENSRPTSSNVFEGTDVDQCEITPETVWVQLTSLWFQSHLLGWIVKMLILRSWTLCMVISFFFETAELSLQFLIPEFQECWWDSIFIDFLGANLLGIYIGWKINTYLNAQEFKWADDDWGHHGGVRLALSQYLTPFAWKEYHWQFFSRIGLFFSAALTAVVSVMMQIHGFFLFHILELPAANKLNGFRLIIVGFIAIPAAGEYYEYIIKKGQRLGPNAWLYVAVWTMEFCFIIKNARHIEQFHVYPPLGVVVPWSTSAVLFGVWLAIYYCTRKEKKEQRPGVPIIVNCLGLKVKRDTLLKVWLVIAMFPLAFLGLNWKF